MKKSEAAARAAELAARVRPVVERLERDQPSATVTALHELLNEAAGLLAEFFGGGVTVYSGGGDKPPPPGGGG